MNDFKKPELLAPAGSLEALKCAVNCGADAVYFGGSAFSARAFAKNISNDELREAIDYAHLRGVRLYTTINTMLKDSELNAAIDYAGNIYEQGVDAVIAADFGLIRALHREFPLLELHASTQACIHSVSGLELLKSMGVKRAVLSRELPLENIYELSGDVELEVFVHGAMCSSVSGACLMSGIIGGRSGNRGMCAQPCRKEYTLFGNTAYHLSMADLCAADILNKLRGVSALKIEGRMKRTEYVAITVSAYRQAIDSAYSPKMREELLKIYNRGGFTHGYLEKGDVTEISRQNHMGVHIGKVIKQSGGKAHIKTSHELKKGDGIEFVSDRSHGGLTLPYADKSGKALIVPALSETAVGDEVYLTTDSDQLKRAREMAECEKKTQISMALDINENFMELIAECKGVSTSAKMPIEEAAKKPIDADRLKAQLIKTGGTPFEAQNCKVSVSGNPFVKMSDLNALRRSVLDELSDKLIKAAAPKFLRTDADSESTEEFCGKITLTAEVPTPTLARAAFEAGADSVQLLPNEYTQELFEYILNFNGNGLMLALPPFMLKEDEEYLKKSLSHLPLIVAGSAGQIPFAKSIADEVRCDIWANLANTQSALAIKAAGADMAAVSVELPLKAIAQIKGIKKQAVVYGRFPLMNLAHCPIKKSGHCGECSAIMTDTLGYKFPLRPLKINNCLLQVLNSAVTAYADIPALKRAGVADIRLNFTTESESDVRRIIKAYADAVMKNTKAEVFADNTGHYLRGVK